MNDDFDDEEAAVLNEHKCLGHQTIAELEACMALEELSAACVLCDTVLTACKDARLSSSQASFSNLLT
jgi:hypothetical protein